MHEIRVSIASPEAADHGVAELWAAGEQVGYTILEDSDLMLRIDPRRDHTAVVVGARSLARVPAAFSANLRKGSPGSTCVVPLERRQSDFTSGASYQRSARAPPLAT